MDENVVAVMLGGMATWQMQEKREVFTKLRSLATVKRYSAAKSIYYS